MKALNKNIIAKVLIAVLSLNLVPQFVWAGEITDRSVTISSSAAGESGVNHSFNISVPSSTAIQSFSAKACTTASDSCTTPSGFDAGSASLLSQPTGFGDSSGWSADTSDPGSIRMQNSTNMTSPGPSQSVTFDGVTNPSDTNTTYFLRITTYSDDSYTNEIDNGVVTASTAEQVHLTSYVPPILTLCVGVSIPTDCSSAKGNSIDLGKFSPGSTSSGTSQMRASTNAINGYVITVNGSTLSSGSNTIDRLATPTASRIGVSQFGMNLRDNVNPDVGSDPTSSGGGTTADYNTVDEFTFNDGDVIAKTAGPTNFNTYTSSYITNIESQQAAGNYTTTLTYIITATF